MCFQIYLCRTWVLHMTFDHINGDKPLFLISDQYKVMEQTLVGFVNKIIVLTDDLTCQMDWMWVQIDPFHLQDD